MLESRWSWCFAFAVGILCLSAPRSPLSAQQPANPTTPGAQIANLQDQLEKGLKARLPREFDFIERVVGMVEAKQLPYDLVQSTFLWARVKRPVPFPYFETGLRTRAARLGIRI
ncbi:MAG: hypothetical protein GX575_08095 [Candidatus Anammoximicrobium sp.]|nr:hypothetical protein [Candidatus Anammoximicrobium sp.]